MSPTFRLPVLAALIFAGCHPVPLEEPQSAPETVPSVEIIQMPFSTVDGDAAFLPYSFGWQCEPFEGEVIDIRNGYSLLQSEPSSLEDEPPLRQIAVIPPDWPCAYVGLSSRTTGLSELATFDSSSPFPGDGVFSLDPHVQADVDEQVQICREGGRSHLSCSIELENQYRGQGVTFILDYRPSDSSDLRYRFSITMTNGLISAFGPL